MLHEETNMFSVFRTLLLIDLGKCTFYRENVVRYLMEALKHICYQKILRP